MKYYILIIYPTKIIIIFTYFKRFFQMKNFYMGYFQKFLTITNLDIYSLGIFYILVKLLSSKY